MRILIFLSLAIFSSFSEREGENCHEDSLLKLSQFTTTSLVCDEDHFFSVLPFSWWKPSYATCSKEDLLWICNTDSNWMAATNLGCRPDASPCTSSVYETCIIVFGPSDAFVCATILVTTLIVLFLGALVALIMLSRMHSALANEIKYRQD